MHYRGPFDETDQGKGSESSSYAGKVNGRAIITREPEEKRLATTDLAAAAEILELPCYYPAS